MSNPLVDLLRNIDASKDPDKSVGPDKLPDSTKYTDVIPPDTTVTPVPDGLQSDYDPTELEIGSVSESMVREESTPLNIGSPSEYLGHVTDYVPSAVDKLSADQLGALDDFWTTQLPYMITSAFDPGRIMNKLEQFVIGPMADNLLGELRTTVNSLLNVGIEKGNEYIDKGLTELRSLARVPGNYLINKFKKDIPGSQEISKDVLKYNESGGREYIDRIPNELNSYSIAPLSTNGIVQRERVGEESSIPGMDDGIKSIKSISLKSKLPNSNTDNSSGDNKVTIYTKNGNKYSDPNLESSTNKNNTDHISNLPSKGDKKIPVIKDNKYTENYTDDNINYIKKEDRIDKIPDSDVNKSSGKDGITEYTKDGNNYSDSNLGPSTDKDSANNKSELPSKGDKNIPVIKDNKYTENYTDDNINYIKKEDKIDKLSKDNKNIPVIKNDDYRGSYTNDNINYIKKEDRITKIPEMDQSSEGIRSQLDTTSVFGNINRDQSYISSTKGTNDPNLYQMNRTPYLSDTNIEGEAGDFGASFGVINSPDIPHSSDDKDPFYYPRSATRPEIAGLKKYDFDTDYDWDAYLSIPVGNNVLPRLPKDYIPITGASFDGISLTSKDMDSLMSMKSINDFTLPSKVTLELLEYNYRCIEHWMESYVATVMQVDPSTKSISILPYKKQALKLEFARWTRDKHHVINYKIYYGIPDISLSYKGASSKSSIKTYSLNFNIIGTSDLSTIEVQPNDASYNDIPYTAHAYNAPATSRDTKGKLPIITLLA